MATPAREAAPPEAPEVLQRAAADMQVGVNPRRAPDSIPGKPGRFSQYEDAIIGGVTVAVFLVAWEALTRARVFSPMFLPGPTDIYLAFISLLEEGTLGRDIWISAQELVGGYVLAIVVGLPLGILMGWYRRLGAALDPFISFFFATPRIALVPLLIIWFGIGIASKIAVVFLGAFFPIVINTMAGVRNLDPNLVKAARAFGATDAQFFRTVALPGSVPFILSGLRLGVGHALIGVVVGELVAAQAGIGLMMANAGATFQTGRVFAGLIIIAVAGIVLTFMLQKIEDRFQAWKPKR